MKVKSILGCNSRSIVSRSRKVIVTQHSLEHTLNIVSSFRSVSTRKMLTNLHDGHQHGVGLWHLPCEERLREWVLFSLVKRWLWRDLTAAWS